MKKLLLTLALLMLASGPARAQVDEDGVCEVPFVRSQDPLNVATFFTWYHRQEQFDCMTARPKESWFLSSDMRRTRQHFIRLKRHGFDAIMPVIYSDPRTRDRGSLDMRLLKKALEIAKQEKLQFIPLFDIAVAADLKEGLCNPFAGICPPETTPVKNYNLDQHRQLQYLVIDMITMIAEEFILPFSHPRRPGRSTARYLTDNNGKLILDEDGRPRPEIYLYIARAWTDNSGRHKTIKAVVRRIKREFRKLGLGKPAFTLDVVQATGKAFDKRIVAAFGDTVVGITSFFEPGLEVDNLGDLTRTVHAPMYAQATKRLRGAIESGLLPPTTQMSVGTAANFDKRRWAQCSGGFGDLAWPAMGEEDVYEAFLNSIAATAEPRSNCAHLLDSEGKARPTHRNKRFIYAGEGYESTWLCAETDNGQFVYPNKYGCQPLHIFQRLTREIDGQQ